MSSSLATLNESHRICRACLATNFVNGQKLDDNWLELFNFSLGFNDKASVIPMYICSGCTTILKVFAEFKKRCVKSRKFWVSIDNGELNYSKSSLSKLQTEITKDEKKNPEIKEIIKTVTKANNSRALIHQRVKIKTLQTSNFCDYCSIQFESPAELIKHQKEECQKIICSICNKPLKTSRNLREHMQNVHSNSPSASTSMQCLHCSKIFKNRKSLQKHVRLLQYEKMKCPICPKEFADYNYLKRHIGYHNDVRKFTCEFCGKAYKTKAALNGHILSHTNENPHECTTCGNRYRTSQRLKIHMTQHTGKSLFNCDFCPKGFNKRYVYNRHIYKMHPDETKESKVYQENSSQSDEDPLEPVEEHRENHETTDVQVKDEANKYSMVDIEINIV